jgi:DNA-binding transcriptional LysR family regulator
MTLKQLEAFYWICRLGSFVAVADYLNATQSTISMRIHDLEESLGVSLFDRGARSVKPTPKGRELLAYVERMMDLTSEIRQRVADPRILAGTVRLGVTELIAVTWMSDLVSAINTQFPLIAVELDVDLTLNQLRKLGSGVLDMALLPGPVPQPELEHIPVGTVDFVWMASPKLGIAPGTYTIDDFKKWPMLSLSRQSNLYGKLGGWFGSGDRASERGHMCNSIGVLAAMTLAGLGVSYLPREYYQAEIEGGQLQVIDTSPVLPALEYYAIYDKRTPQPLVYTIARLAQEYTQFRTDAQS